MAAETSGWVERATDTTASVRTGSRWLGLQVWCVGSRRTGAQMRAVRPARPRSALPGQAECAREQPADGPVSLRDTAIGARTGGRGVHVSCGNGRRVRVPEGPTTGSSPGNGNGDRRGRGGSARKRNGVKGTAHAPGLATSAATVGYPVRPVRTRKKARATGQQVESSS